MVLCSKCKKRPAVVFISALRGEESKNEGYCLVCARDLNIPQVSDYLKSHYINEDDLEEFSDRMMEMMQEDIPDLMEDELNQFNDAGIMMNLSAVPLMQCRVSSAICSPAGMPGMPSPECTAYIPGHGAISAKAAKNAEPKKVRKKMSTPKGKRI